MEKEDEKPVLLFATSLRFCFEELVRRTTLIVVSVLRTVPLPARTLHTKTVGTSYPLGFETKRLDLSESGSAKSTILEGMTLRVERLLVPSDIASSFLIEDLIVDGKSILNRAAACGDIPARTFQENAIGIRLAAPQAKESIEIKMRNIGGCPCQFRAILICEVENA